MHSNNSIVSEDTKDILAESTSENQTSSYRSIFKATSLFGGVQLYSILIQIIKSKVIAVLLGPLGVGLQGLYQSALDLVKQTTSLGISQSAVRDVAEASGSGDIKRISKTITVLRRIVWFTGLLGLIVIATFSPLLSETSFGNKDYIIPFIFLSVILLFDQLSSGQKVLLQGTRRLKDLAKATAIGVTVSLLFSLPLYYFWGESGIVPAMILTSATTLGVSWYYSRRIEIKEIPVTSREVFAEGKTMIVMGISMSLSGVMTMGGAYLIRSLIRKWGGIDEVGLFHAGFVIINTYVGLVFSAIATDYYPRLAAVNKDDEKCKDVVSKQGEISIYLLAPLLSICILLMPFVIELLYSNQFLPADSFIKWACVGMMFRLSSWLVSYIFVAKAESKLFLVNEFIGTFNYIWISIWGYKLGGLTGMGIAFSANYFVYFLQVYLIAHKRYGFTFSIEYLRSFLVQLTLVTLCLAVMLLLKGVEKYVFGSILVLLTIYVSLLGINNRIGLKSFLQSKIHK